MNDHASRAMEAWPLHQAEFGTTVTYTSAGDSETYSFVAVVHGRQENMSANDTWEMNARQIEVHASSADAPADCAVRQDIIAVNGANYIVLERQDYGDGLYRYLCERTELEGVQHRGRRF